MAEKRSRTDRVERNAGCRSVYVRSPPRQSILRFRVIVSLFACLAGSQAAWCGSARAVEAAVRSPEENIPPVLRAAQTPTGSVHWGPLSILGDEIAPGQKRELFLPISESFAGTTIETPVVVVHGVAPGMTFCVTAGVHGDELNGVEIARRVLDDIDPMQLRGTVLGVPIVNIHGFRRASRYLPDRRDLNRYFPGDPHGSSASRIAFALFDNVIRHCDALADLHSGSLHRTNLPQVRGDLRNGRVRDLAIGFGTRVVVHKEGAQGTLRRAATQVGIPAIIYEAGEPMRLQEHEIERGIAGVRNTLIWLGMLDGERRAAAEPSLYYHSYWVRADAGGILVTETTLGQFVEEGELLGIITDPVRKERAYVNTAHRGRVIGMTLAPVMIPGSAAFHIGVKDGEPLAGMIPTPKTATAPAVGELEELGGAEEERPE